MGIKLSDSDRFSQQPQVSLGGSSWQCWAQEAGRQLSLGELGAVPLVLAWGQSCSSPACLN